MKTMLYSAVLLVGMAFCNDDAGEPYSPAVFTKHSEYVAMQVVVALQNMSSKEYILLFPRVEDFYQVMDDNHQFYGDNLSVAKQEFLFAYETHVIAEVSESFDRVLREGKLKGISWRNIEFERVELSKAKEHPPGMTSLVIVFSANGIAHKISLERVLLINGQCKVSQFIKLI